MKYRVQKVLGLSVLMVSYCLHVVAWGYFPTVIWNDSDEHDSRWNADYISIFGAIIIHDRGSFNIVGKMVFVAMAWDCQNDEYKE